MPVPISGYELAYMICDMCSKNLDSLLNVVDLSETAFIELKAVVEPKDGILDKNTKIDDYYWHVTRALVALSNSSGGVLIIGISESDYKCETVDLNWGKNEDKYINGILNKIINYKQNEIVINKNRKKIQRHSLKSKWETMIKEHGDGVWSIDADNLRYYCNPIPCKFAESKVLAIFVRPIPNEKNLIVAKFEGTESDKSKDCVLIRECGHVGKVKHIYDIDSIQNYISSRNIYVGENFGYFMKFLAEFYPDDSDDTRLKKANRFIQDLREGRKIIFDPLPDANLSPSDRDIADVNVTLSEPDYDYPLAFTDMPFELGSTWGLDRGAYVLLTDAPPDNAYGTLVRSEIILRKELEAIGKTSMLAERWWLRLDISKCPEGPDSKEDIFNSCINPEDELVKGLKRLRQWQRADDRRFIIPGFLLEANPFQVCNMGAWCRQAFMLIDDFPRDKLAIVICLRAVENPSSSLSEVMRDLRSSLALPECIPVLVSQWIKPIDQFPVPDLNQKQSVSVFDILPGPPGSSLLKLLNKFAQENSEYMAKEINNRPSILTVIQELSSKTGTGNFSPILDAGGIVRDLEGINQWAPSFASDKCQRLKLYTDILELVGLFGKPDLRRRLISIIASGTMEELRHAALEFAMKKDIFLDWWVEGAGNEMERYPQIDFLIDLKMNSGLTRPPLQRLVLAMLRSSRYTPGLLNIIHRRYRKFLLSDFCQLLDIPNTGMKYSQCTDVLVPIAILAAKSPDISDFEKMPLQSFSSQYLWWILQSSPVKREWLRKIIKLSAEKKAILGLVNPSETSTLDADQIKIITEFRRGIPLSYHQSTSPKPYGSSLC